MLGTMVAGGPFVYVAGFADPAGREGPVVVDFVSAESALDDAALRATAAVAIAGVAPFPDLDAEARAAEALATIAERSFAWRSFSPSCVRASGGALYVAVVPDDREPSGLLVTWFSHPQPDRGRAATAPLLAWALAAAGDVPGATDAERQATAEAWVAERAWAYRAFAPDRLDADSEDANGLADTSRPLSA